MGLRRELISQSNQLIFTIFLSFFNSSFSNFFISPVDMIICLKIGFPFLNFFIFSFFLYLFCSLFFLYKKWHQNVIKKSNKCYKEKPVKTIKIFLKKKKHSTWHVHNWYRKLFIDNEPREEEKEWKTSIWAWSIKEDKGRKYAPEKYRNLSKEKKKTKSVNILKNDTKSFLKVFNFV